MAIVFKLEADGGFVAGDEKTGMTAYAYPTSPHATEAKRAPAKVAAEMLHAEWAHMRDYPSVQDYDKRNWGRLYPQLSKAYS